MTLKINFDYSPAYELLVSAYLYLHPSSRSDLGAAWVKGVRNRLSAQLATEMNDKRLEVIHRLAILVWQCPDKTSTDAFLDWLESLTVGEIIERMIPWVNEFKEDMRVVKERIIHVLRGWSQEYFKDFDPLILENLQKSHRDEVKRALSETPDAQFERLTKGMYLEPSDTEQTVILIPQYHLSPHNILDFYEEGLVVCQYPVTPTSSHEAPHSNLVRIASALADEHRLKILVLVSRGPKTYPEIVQTLNLGKSLVSYHLTQLRLAGLLQAHYRNGKLLHYQLRQKQMTGFTQDLLRITTVTP